MEKGNAATHKIFLLGSILRKINSADQLVAASINCASPNQKFLTRIALVDFIIKTETSSITLKILFLAYIFPIVVKSSYGSQDLATFLIVQLTWIITIIYLYGGILSTKRSWYLELRFS